MALQPHVTNSKDHPSWKEYKKMYPNAKSGLEGKNNPAKREEVRTKISESLSGRTFSIEHKEKLSEARKGVEPWNKGKTKEDDERIRKGSKKMAKTIRERGQWNEGMKQDEWLPHDALRKLKEYQKSDEISKNGLSYRTPTGLEKQFIEICEQFDLHFKYVGNGEFWMGNPPMNPDFVDVNGKKVAVEILGDYWHNENEFKERQEKFAEYGWKCIGIWGHELRKLSEEKIVEKVNVL